MSGTVTVVTATKYASGRRRWLKELNDAVLSLPNTEHVIVNSGYSAGLPDKFKSPNTRILNLKKDEGETRAKKLGLGVARGQMVIFVDDDDVLYPEALSAMVTRMYEDRVIWASGHVVSVDEVGNQGDVHHHEHRYGRHITRSLLAAGPGKYFEEPVHPAGVLAIRQAWVSVVGSVPESIESVRGQIVQGNPWFGMYATLALLARSGGDVVPEVVVGKRSHSGQQSSANRYWTRELRARQGAWERVS